jgi:hypothetical protein
MEELTYEEKYPRHYLYIESKEMKWLKKQFFREKTGGS